MKKEDYPDLKYWSKFRECEITQVDSKPYFCLNTLWTVTKFDYEHGVKTVKEWRPYFYSLN